MLQHHDDECRCGSGVYERELSHRFANGLQQAIAAVHLVRRHGDGHIDDAMGRLAGIAELNGLLAAPGTDDPVDLVDAVDDVASAVARSVGATGVTIMLHGEPLLTTARRARPLLMAVAEIVGNAIRHGLGRGGGSVAIDVFDDGVETDVLIEDDGRCRGWTRPGGQGHGIVDALAASLGGKVTRKVTRMGSANVGLTVPSVAAALPFAGHA